MEKNEFELMSLVKSGWESLINTFKIKRAEVTTLQEDLTTADTNKDGKIQFEELRKKLKRTGKSEAQIEEVFSKYDKDGNRELNEEEQAEMHEDLEVGCTDR